MKREFKRGFTIVELMMVVAVIAILAGIITMGVNGMFRVARQKRAMAMKRVLQSGLETYYAQHNKWPGNISDYADVDKDTVELDNGTGRPESAHGASPQTDKAFQEIVQWSIVSGKPVLDPSGLFVTESRSSGYCCDNHHAQSHSGSFGYCGAKKGCPRGMDFSEAVKNAKNRKKISINNMTFGYQGANNGYFCRYRILFHPRTDSVEVKMQPVAEYDNEEGFKDD